MTDNYGTDPQNPEEDFQEGASIEEAEVTEAPSEEEFADASSMDLPDEKPHRRSALLPIIAAIGGVVLLGYVAWTVGSDSSQLLSSVKQMALGSPSTQPPADFPADQALKAPEESVQKTEGLAQQASEPTAIPPSGDFAAPPAGAPEAVAPQTGEPAGQAKALNAETAKALIAAAQARRAGAGGASPSSTQIEDINSKIAILSARIDTLQSGFDQANQFLSQLSGAIAATSTATARLDNLEHKLEALGRAAPAKKAATKPQKRTAAKKARDEDEDVAKTPKPTPKAKKTQRAEQEEAIEPSINWVLRAAAPNRAWISQSPTSQDLREVHVGDAVPGIGRITAIEMRGDSWVIFGTKRSIH